MDKQTQIREELDEWLAEGKIDRATYDRLIAEQTGEPSDVLGGGWLAGAAAIALGEALGLLVLDRTNDLQAVMWISGALTLAFGVFAMMLVRSGRGDLGRCSAIVSSALWTQTFFAWMFRDFPPDGKYISTCFAMLAGGHALIAYLTTSSLAALRACLWMIPAVMFYVQEWDDGTYTIGTYMMYFALLGAAYLVAAREHLVLRWPAGPLSMRFARAYQVVALSLINWAVYVIAWYGWDGGGYRDVGMRMLGVAVSVVVYGLEMWAGQKSRMPWVAAMGVIHFLLQIQAILSYPYLSLAHRAMLIIAFAMLLILVSQGESSSRKG